MIKNSLKNKIGVSVFLVIFIFGLFATSSVFLYSKDNFLKIENSKLVNSVVEQTHEIGRIFFETRGLAKKISEQKFIINFLEGEGQIQDPIILDRLNSYNINDSFSSIYLLDSKGNTLVSTDESFVGNNYAFRDYFKKIKQEGLDNYLDVAIGVTSRKLGYYLSYSIKNKDVLLGVVVLKLKPEVVNNILHLTNSNFNYISIVDDYGVSVYSNKQDLFYKSIVRLSDIDINIIRKKKRFPNIEIDSLGYNILRSDLSNIRVSDIFNVIDKDEDNAVLAIARIYDFPFFVIVEEKEEVILSGILDFSYLLSFFVILASFLASLLTLFIVSYFTRPLVKMNDIFKEAIRGDLSQRVIVETKDEIGEIGENFNKLVSKLQNSLKNVEEEVEDRTKQLEDVNRVMVGRELKMVELKKELLKNKNKKNGE